MTLTIEIAYMHKINWSLLRAKTPLIHHLRITDENGTPQSALPMTLYIPGYMLAPATCTPQTIMSVPMPWNYERGAALIDNQPEKLLLTLAHHHIELTVELLAYNEWNGMDSIEVSSGTIQISQQGQLSFSQWDYRYITRPAIVKGAASLVLVNNAEVQCLETWIHRRLRYRLGKVNPALADVVMTRTGPRELMKAMYDVLSEGISIHTIELPCVGPTSQRIRLPTEIIESHSATCIDIAFLYCALMERVGLVPLLIILEENGLRHALIGYDDAGASSTTAICEDGERFRSWVSTGWIYPVDVMALAQDKPFAHAARRGKQLIKRMTFCYALNILLLRDAPHSIHPLPYATAAQCTAALPFPPPLVSSPLPLARRLIGRKHLLRQYIARLHQVGWTVIAGPIGVGKSALGAQLAVQLQPKKRTQIFWYTFYHTVNTDLVSVLHALSHFLAGLGNRTLYSFLPFSSPEPAAGSQQSFQLILEQAINILIAALNRDNYVLCFDDFHEAEQNPQLTMLFQRLATHLVGNKTKIIVMSRQWPSFASALGSTDEQLRGLGPEEIEEFLHRSGGIQLNQEEVAELGRLTNGHPKELQLYVDSMLHPFNPQDNLARLAGYQGERLRSDYRALSPGERNLIKVLSVFRLPATDEAIGVAAEGEEVSDIDVVLDTLSDRFLIEQTADGHKYLHDLLKTFTYSRLQMEAPQARRIHLRLGQYFERIQVAVEAAYHYFQATAFAASAQVLCSQLEQIIQRGQLHAVYESLEKLVTLQHGDRASLAAAEWRDLYVAKGDSHLLLGEHELAYTAYETALQHHDEQAGDWYAAIRRRMGKVWERTAHFELAIDAYQEAATSLATVDTRSIELVRLHKDEAWCHYRLGDHQRARVLCEESLERVDIFGNRHTREAAELYNVLGVIAMDAGNFPTAIHYLEKSLSFFQKIADHYNIAGSFHNLNIVYWKAGDVVRAHASAAQALELRKQISDQRGIATSTLGFGVIAAENDQLQDALRYFQESYELFHMLEDSLGKSMALSNCAEIRLRLHHDQDALRDFAQAIELSYQIKDKDGLLECREVLLAYAKQFGVNEAVPYPEQNDTEADLDELWRQGNTLIEEYRRSIS